MVLKPKGRTARCNMRQATHPQGRVDEVSRLFPMAFGDDLPCPGCFEAHAENDRPHRWC